MDEPEQFNDVLYWRLPLPPLPDDPMEECAPAQNATQGQMSISTSEAEESYNDLHYWRYPPATLTPDQGPEVGMPRPGSPERYTLNEDLAYEEDAHHAEDDDEEEADQPQDDDPMGLLSGGAGARLLGLLGQLSAHLGTSSRFARAAGLLQEDMQRQRDYVLRLHDEDRRAGSMPASMDEEETEQQSEAPRPHPRRIEPLAGSTLQQPEVLNSVGSLLHILQSNEQLQPPQETPQAPPLVLFDMVQDQAEPPPSPASPASVADLSPPCPSFGLDDTAPSCPICLECIDGTSLEALLQMPCARQHVFHKTCLLTWLGTRNTCPVCRHGLPEATDEEMADYAAAQSQSPPRAAEEGPAGAAPGDE